MYHRICGVILAVLISICTVCTVGNMYRGDKVAALLSASLVGMCSFVCIVNIIAIAKEK